MKVKFTSTALSSSEKSLIAKIFANTSFVLEESMSVESSYLLSYKSVCTEKKALADKWGIPAISVLWVYESLSEKTILSYRLKKYDGCIFSTSGITNPIFINYYRLLGGHFSTELNRYCDFLVVKSLEHSSSKVEYAEDNSIGVVPAEEVFYERSRGNREIVYDTFSQDVLEEELFNGIVFLIEGVSEIARLVRCKVIEYGGSRVEREGSDTHYEVYFGGSRKGKKAVWYHWVLDSIELGTLLSPEPYRIPAHPAPELPLARCTVFIGVCREEAIKTRNKVLALGGEVTQQINSQVTHCIIEDKKSLSRIKIKEIDRYKISICTLEWLNQCIYHLKRVKEGRFHVLCSGQEIKHTPLPITDENRPEPRTTIRIQPSAFTGWVVQFSGVSEGLRAEAARVFETKGAVVVDSQVYSTKCTHMVIGVVNVSLKFLSSVATGTYLLDYSVVDDLKSNTFTTEADYALSSARIRADARKLEHLVKQLTLAAKEWRKVKAQTGKGAFNNWKVTVLAEKDRATIEQLITNGDGQILADPDPSTRLFIDKETTAPGNLPNDTIQMKDILKYLVKAHANAHAKASVPPPSGPNQ
ncbi:hypothetical protein NEDG_01299 [Nematocida displodere]|uniref:BRCT domain-containing protein n=1 Tax=Nematocida displodere TaxID=1805483 RepID=A0A177EBW9_9MICR|nr:hypothetical protein NEDG_01299 [Nematocida displodere]